LRRSNAARAEQDDNNDGFDAATLGHGEFLCRDGDNEAARTSDSSSQTLVDLSNNRFPLFSIML
jgi:hypothetical protein